MATEIHARELSISLLFSEAKERVKSLSETSRVFDLEKEQRIPRIRKEEITLDKLLGRGRFCVATEISSIRLKLPMNKNRYEREEEDRDFLKRQCNRHGEARYAIKTLSDDTKRGHAHILLRGTIDMALETRFLSVLEHPNIIRMRAVADCSPYDDGYFIVLDRLHCTLSQRLVTWRRKHHYARSLINILRGTSKKKTNECLVEQLLVTYSISRAMTYLHQKNIIHRDLKPENIGFDVRDDVKIFDFGFAKEIYPEDKLPDGTYILTGMTGSIRYMAPEVHRSAPYNSSADVYSFAILLWEMLALRTPFEHYTKEMHKDIVINKGFRPHIERNWPDRLASILTQSWSKDIQDRLTFKAINAAIREEIRALINGDECLDMLVDFSNRTAKSDCRRGQEISSPTNQLQGC